MAIHAASCLQTADIRIRYTKEVETELNDTKHETFNIFSKNKTTQTFWEEKENWDSSVKLALKKCRLSFPNKTGNSRKNPERSSSKETDGYTTTRKLKSWISLPTKDSEDKQRQHVLRIDVDN